jgi:hypothetical protein
LRPHFRFGDSFYQTIYLRARHPQITRDFQRDLFGKSSFNSGFLRNADDVGWLMQTNPSLKNTRYSNTESFAD